MGEVSSALDFMLHARCSLLSAIPFSTQPQQRGHLLFGIADRVSTHRRTSAIRLKPCAIPRGHAQVLDFPIEVELRGDAFRTIYQAVQKAMTNEGGLTRQAHFNDATSTKQGYRFFSEPQATDV